MVRHVFSHVCSPVTPTYSAYAYIAASLANTCYRTFSLTGGEYIGTLKDQPEWSDMPDMLANAYRAGHKVSDEPGTINTSGGVDARLVMGPFEGLPDEGDDGEDSDDDAAKAAIKYANKVAGKVCGTLARTLSGADCDNL